MNKQKSISYICYVHPDDSLDICKESMEIHQNQFPILRFHQMTRSEFEMGCLLLRCTPEEFWSKGHAFIVPLREDIFNGVKLDIDYNLN